MNFEFDSAKSAANLDKHGIDFIDAQALWSDQVLGRIGNVVWSAFTTIRGVRIRIISVRRARDEEAAAYFEA